jgi:hypothetical protein
MRLALCGLAVASVGLSAPEKAAQPPGTLRVGGNAVLGEGAAVAWNYSAGAGDLVQVAGSLWLPTNATISVAALGGSMPAPAVVLSAATLGGMTDLSAWSVAGLEGYRPAVSGNTVVLQQIPAATLLTVR